MPIARPVRDSMWAVTLRVDNDPLAAGTMSPSTIVTVLSNLASTISHAWLTIESPLGRRLDVGFWPRDETPGKIRIGDLIAPGAVRIGDFSHLAAQDGAFRYAISRQQAEAALLAVQEWERRDHTYIASSQNCLTFSHAIMTAAGIPLIHPDPMHELHTVTLTAFPPAHDPAVYLQRLRETPEGQEAHVRAMVAEGPSAPAVPDASYVAGVEDLLAEANWLAEHGENEGFDGAEVKTPSSGQHEQDPDDPDGDTGGSGAAGKTHPTRQHEHEQDPDDPDGDTGDGN